MFSLWTKAKTHLGLNTTEASTSEERLGLLSHSSEEDISEEDVFVRADLTTGTTPPSSPVDKDSKASFPSTSTTSSTQQHTQKPPLDRVETDYALAQKLEVTETTSSEHHEQKPPLDRVETDHALAQKLEVNETTFSEHHEQKPPLERIETDDVLAQKLEVNETTSSEHHEQKPPLERVETDYALLELVKTSASLSNNPPLHQRDAKTNLTIHINGTTLHSEPELIKHFQQMANKTNEPAQESSLKNRGPSLQMIIPSQPSLTEPTTKSTWWDNTTACCFTLFTCCAMPPEPELNSYKKNDDISRRKLPFSR